MVSRSFRSTAGLVIGRVSGPFLTGIHPKPLDRLSPTAHRPVYIWFDIYDLEERHI